MCVSVCVMMVACGGGDCSGCGPPTSARRQQDRALTAAPRPQDEAWGTLSPSQGEEPAADMEEAVANGNGHAEEAPAATTNGNARGEEDSAPEDADRAEAPVDTDAMETDAAKAT